jgi:DNA repair exonuclease SbcCD ATPase subunit
MKNDMQAMQAIQALRHKLERRKGQRNQLQKVIDRLETQIRTNKRNFIRHEKALQIVKHVGLKTQKQLEYHLAEQVSLAMDAVFDDPYRLKVDFLEKRGKTEVELLFTRRGMEFPPIGSAGGGAIDVASIALRVAYWSMRRDKKARPLLLLDEPFSQLKGEDANRRALSIIQELSHKLKLQIIMVSDERVPREDIMNNADKVFQVVQGKDGISQINVL